jgi:demethylmenaquinone methyltransferase/2-methoxy-6-polyprenyl-1,4-benzoquinol methylase
MLEDRFHAKGRVPMTATLHDYYSRRAQTYERVYEKPERQEDLAALSGALQERLSGAELLEIACGTGYWTERLAPAVRSLLGVDFSADVLEIAQKKNIPRVRFLQDDAYSLARVKGFFTAGFAGFWWSHVPKSKLRAFLERLHAKLAPEAKIVFIDNCYVEGNSHPLTRRDAEGNSYQRRALPDGTQHEVLKNFPTDDELTKAVAPFSSALEIKRFSYYWLLEYRLVRP